MSFNIQGTWFVIVYIGWFNDALTKFLSKQHNGKKLTTETMHTIEADTLTFFRMVVANVCH